MAISRYSRDILVNRGRAFGTAGGVNRIRQAIRQNQLAVKQVTMNEDARLDVMAGREYGDASLWWVIAAASNIGWGLQVPAGTRILIPTVLAQIADLVE